MKGQKKSAGADALQPALSPMHLSPPYVKCSRPFQAELNKASGSEPVPEQVCDSSTCVSAGARFSFSRPDKESDHHWQKTKKKKKKKRICQLPGRLEPSKESDFPQHPPALPRWCWQGAGKEEGGRGWRRAEFRYLWFLVNSQPFDDNHYWFYIYPGFPRPPLIKDQVKTKSLNPSCFNVLSHLKYFNRFEYKVVRGKRCLHLWLIAQPL